MNSPNAEILPRLWNKQYAVPQEKGAWIWWIAPLLIGIAAAEQITLALVPLTIAALTGFLLRQPLTLLVKTLSGRRHQRNLLPVSIWLGFYSLILTTCAAWLWFTGHRWILGLAAITAPVVFWHEWLVSRSEERRQPLLDIAAAVAAGATAPAAYWACGGTAALTPWILWLLVSLQASASIVHMFLRFHQRLYTEMPHLGDRWKEGSLPLAHHVCNVLTSTWMADLGWISGWVVAAFGVTLAEGIFAVVHPQINQPARALGMRQLGTSTLFFVLMLPGS